MNQNAVNHTVSMEHGPPVEVAARSLSEVVDWANARWGCGGVHVFLRDGTLVDDEDYFACLPPGTSFVTSLSDRFPLPEIIAALQRNPSCISTLNKEQLNLVCEYYFGKHMEAAAPTAPNAMCQLLIKMQNCTI
ncbi:nesp012 [Neophasia sp. alphabaculovirus]|nr:nesp012 [Neophasia sp. alphabaculovirus]